MKQLRQKLLGNEGKGFVEAEKWYRDLNQEIKHYENGAPKMLDVVVGRSPSDNLAMAVQHWADLLTQRGEYLDLQKFENCPELLYDVLQLLLISSTASLSISRSNSVTPFSRFSSFPLLVCGFHSKK